MFLWQKSKSTLLPILGIVAVLLTAVGCAHQQAVNKGEEAMRAEFERIVPLMKTGGFIPSVDHQTPPGVSLQEYRVYLRVLAEYTSL